MKEKRVGEVYRSGERGIGEGINKWKSGGEGRGRRDGGTHSLVGRGVPSGSKKSRTAMKAIAIVPPRVYHSKSEQSSVTITGENALIYYVKWLTIITCLMNTMFNNSHIHHERVHG